MFRLSAVDLKAGGNRLFLQLPFPLQSVSTDMFLGETQLPKLVKMLHDTMIWYELSDNLQFTYLHFTFIQIFLDSGRSLMIFFSKFPMGVEFKSLIRIYLFVTNKSFNNGTVLL